MPPLRVFEFYSGIGGMHFALQATDVPFSVVAAADINTAANDVYRHNFPGTKLLQRNIQSLSAAELDALGAELWTLSPPCQPFTRNGLQRDAGDRRTDSLLALLDQMPAMLRLPRLLFLENVAGFEHSETRGRLVETLGGLGFGLKEFLLSPPAFGFPNARLRYYLLASRDWKGAAALSTCPPGEANGTPTLRPLSAFLDAGAWDDESLRVPSKVVEGRRAGVLDVVGPASTHSTCFTKAYTHYADGTGSVLLPQPQAEELSAAASPMAKVALLRALHPRYFGPTEVSRLLGFPPSLGFPEASSRRQRYRLLGNSISVGVVSALMRTLLMRDVVV